MAYVSSIEISMVLVGFSYEHTRGNSRLIRTPMSQLERIKESGAVEHLRHTHDHG